MIEELLRELARVRSEHRGSIDRALARLADWMEAHPDATPDEVAASEEFRRVLREFDRELNEMHGVLVESLPAMISEGMRA